MNGRLHSYKYYTEKDDDPMKSNHNKHISDMMDYMRARHALKNLATLDQFCDTYGLGYGSHDAHVIYITHCTDDGIPVWLSVVTADGQIEHDFNAPVPAHIMNELTDVLSALIKHNPQLFSQSRSNASPNTPVTA